MNEKEFEIESGILKRYNGSDKHVVVPEGVTEIENGAFTGCNNIKSIVLPEGVTVIRGGAFDYCENLESVSLPTTLTRIEDGAFFECNSLNRICINDLKTWAEKIWDHNVESFWTDALELYVDGCRVENLVIPDGVSVISSGAFMCFDSIKSGLIPEGVTEIQDCAFFLCTNLKDITLPMSLTKIGDDAFGEDLDNLTIHAPAGSFAEEFAKEFEITYEAV